MLPICSGVVPEANWNTSRSGESRVSPIGGMPEPGGSGMTGMSMRRVPGGAPLPPCIPLARLPALTWTLRSVPLPTAPAPTRTLRSPPLPTVPMGAAAGWPKAVWKVKPAPLGVRACGLSLKPASIALSMAPAMAWPDILRDHRRHGDLHLAQFDAVGRHIDGLRQGR